eukprot:606739-Pleurochrysis_carterae.AAC.1
MATVDPSGSGSNPNIDEFLNSMERIHTGLDSEIRTGLDIEQPNKKLQIINDCLGEIFAHENSLRTALRGKDYRTRIEAFSSFFAIIRLHNLFRTLGNSIWLEYVKKVNDFYGLTQETEVHVNQAEVLKALNDLTDTQDENSRQLSDINFIIHSLQTDTGLEQLAIKIQKFRVQSSDNSNFQKIDEDLYGKALATLREQHDSNFHYESDPQHMSEEYEEEEMKLSEQDSDNKVMTDEGLTLVDTDD